MGALQQPPPADVADEIVQFTLMVRRCHTPSCTHYRPAYRPEEHSALALPYGEFGLDVIALIGQLRYRDSGACRRVLAAGQGPVDRYG